MEVKCHAKGFILWALGVMEEFGACKRTDTTKISLAAVMEKTGACRPGPRLFTACGEMERVQTEAHVLEVQTLEPVKEGLRGQRALGLVQSRRGGWER